MNVDFKSLKERIGIADVLRHYQLSLPPTRKESARINCPLPSHPKDGSDQSCSIHVGKNTFYCHSKRCQESSSVRSQGDVLNFVRAMEACTLREAGLKLATWFPIGEPARVVVDAASDKQNPINAVGESDAAINPPLDFRLKVAIGEPGEFLTQRGLTPETCAHFGAGLCESNSKLFGGRFVIELQRPDGLHCGYLGRALTDEQEQIGKYVLPPNERGFFSSHLLFNVHRALLVSPAVVLVENPLVAMWLWQRGLPAVSSFGSSLSDVQAKLLSRFQRVLILYDGDEAGRVGASAAIEKLAPAVWVRRYDLPDGLQPDDLKDIGFLFDFVR